MKYFITLFGAVMLLGSCRQAAEPIPDGKLTMGSPESEGLSPDRLDGISRMLDQAVTDGHVPGGVALIARNGKVVYHYAFGMSDIQNNRSFSKEAIFRIASQTKAITATAVMMLWEEGRFRLDDPISRYIPEFKEPHVITGFDEKDTTFTAEPAGMEITIRHLLTHTSGIGYGVIDRDPRFRMIYKKAGITDLFTTEDIPIETSVLKLAELPLHHKPGENFTYSEGLDVLGYFVEVLTDMPFDSFLRERIFDPLGMDDTWFYLPESRADRLVPVQHLKDGQWEHYPVTFYDPDYPVKGARRFFSGGAGLSSTPMDYAVFLQMYLNKGEYNGIRLLSRTTVETMMANQIGDLWANGPKDYGLAFGLVNQDGVGFGGQGGLGTFDWGGYFNTQYFADPGEQLIGILMKQTQGAPSDQTGWKFRQMTFASVDD